MPEELRGREVVVVGGAGGIGTAVTELLLGEGARLVVTYRTRAERAARFASAAAVVQADLAKTADRRRLLDASPSCYGLVILAGDPARYSGEADADAAMQKSHDSNYAGPIQLARESAFRMKSAGVPGAIVLFSTMQANALFPGSLVYSAEKAALQHAARVLAKEYRGAGIRINVVSPGVTAAGMAESSIAAGKYDRYLKESVITRFGRPADIARAVRFFLEPDNYVTGQVLCVDGGITL